MKKAATCILWIAFVITIIAHAIIGIKLLDGDYEFTVEAYIGAAGFFTIFVCRHGQNIFDIARRHSELDRNTKLSTTT